MTKAKTDYSILDQLKKAAKAYYKLWSANKETEKPLKKAKATLSELFAKEGVGEASIQVSRGVEVQRTGPYTTYTLNAEKLMASGVSEETIKACTDASEPWYKIEVKAK